MSKAPSYEIEVVEAGAELFVCGVGYEVPQEAIDRHRARIARRRILEEVDEEGVVTYRYDPPIED